MIHFIPCSPKKLCIALVALIAMGATFVMVFSYFNFSIITQEFVSAESKNKQGVHEKNQITFIPGLEQDIWLMRQTPSNSGLPMKQRDLLAIKVKDKKAYFYQLEPNSSLKPEEWQTKSFRAPCAVCHSNGPRALRPKRTRNLWSKLKIQLLNIRIKSYGNLTNLAGKSEDQKDFHFLSSKRIFEMDLPTCKKCHYEGGLRGPLSNEQWSTIRHLVGIKAMPPWPFKISDEEKKLLKILD